MNVQWPAIWQANSAAGFSESSGCLFISTSAWLSWIRKSQVSFFSISHHNKAGLDHTSFRKYESSSGRWTSPDPLSGGNAYAYAANDPVNNVDPSGLMPCQPGVYSAECDASGFSGWGGGYLGGNGRGHDPPPGLDTIRDRGNYPPTIV